MKQYLYLFLTALFLIYGCSQSYKEQASSSDMINEESPAAELSMEQDMAVSGRMSAKKQNTQDADYLITDIFSSMAARNETFPDSLMQLIRTADIQFRVGNVIKATLDIESITRKSGGYVEDTKLTTNVYSLHQVYVAKDTILEISKSRLTNEFILRIPSEKLDEALLQLVPLIEHLNHRNINVNDVSIERLAKQLEQVRIAKYSKRMENAIDNKGQKLNDITGAENSLLQRQQQADEAKIADLYLRKQIALSTVRLSIYQNEGLSYDKHYVETNIKQYSPSFGSKLIESLKSGFSVMQSIILFVVEVWWLWLMVAIIYIVYKRFIKRKNNL